MGVACFDVVLVYFISAGAGIQANILAERCSVMPLKCVCCVSPQKMT
jgi:hypothetical protein